MSEPSDGSFEAWYRAEHPRLITSVQLLVGDLETARDITAEAFSRALERWPRVGAMESPVGWTYQVALNLVRRRWRKTRAERALTRQQHQLTGPAFDPAIEVWEAVRSLPLRQRTALVLFYLVDLPLAEVAEVMGVTAGTVAATLHAARRRLGSALSVDSCVEEV